MQYEDSGEFFLYFLELKNDSETLTWKCFMFQDRFSLKGSGHVMWA